MGDSGTAAFLSGAYTAGVKSEQPIALGAGDYPPAPGALAGSAGNGEADEDDDNDSDDDIEEGDTDLAANLSEKLYQVQSYLQRLPGHPFVTFADLSEKTGVDLHLDEDVLERLAQNERIMVDAENKRVKFKPRADIHDLPTLLASLSRFPDGISVSEIEECGPEGIAEVVEQAVLWGLVIAVRNRQATGGTSHIVLFPRGANFLTQLTGTFSAEQFGQKLTGAATMATGEVRRGDALFVGRESTDALDNIDPNWLARRAFRVSAESSLPTQNETRPAVVLESLSRLPVPYSRSSNRDPLPRKNSEFMRTFTDIKVPLATQLREPQALHNTTVFKHGCTNDVRRVWRRACDKHKYRPADVAAVNRMLLDHGLVSEEWLAKDSASVLKRRQQVKKKKRRAGRRVTKLTNAHLD